MLLQLQDGMALETKWLTQGSIHNLFTEDLLSQSLILFHSGEKATQVSLEILSALLVANYNPETIQAVFQVTLLLEMKHKPIYFNNL